MADTMQFDLVSPERRLASGPATAVQIPGAAGDFTAMAGHAATIATMRPGIVRVSSPEGDAQYVVTGGFAEIGDAGLSVLAERAVPVAEVTQEVFDTLVATAVTARDHAAPEMVDEMAKQVADIAAVGTELGLQAKI